MNNFEKYKTVEERFTAHDKWCCNNPRACLEFLNDGCEDCVMCAFKWLDMEADADENHKK